MIPYLSLLYIEIACQSVSSRLKSSFLKFEFGGVAQLIEHSVHTRQVGGLNPLPATIFILNSPYHDIPFWHYHA